MDDLPSQVGAAGGKILEFSISLFILVMVAVAFTIRWWYDGKRIASLIAEKEALQKGFLEYVTNREKEYRDELNAREDKHRAQIELMQKTMIERTAEFTNQVARVMDRVMLFLEYGAKPTMPKIADSPRQETR